MLWQHRPKLRSHSSSRTMRPPGAGDLYECPDGWESQCCGRGMERHHGDGEFGDRLERECVHPGGRTDGAIGQVQPGDFRGAGGAPPPPPPGPALVTTYHYDTLRTGWNNQETMLTASSFPSTFGILKTVQLDDQVDVQPLVVPGSQIANGGLTTDDVAYVATENNTVYAIDASTGAILLSRNLGSPVPNPLGNNNNGPHVGLNGTPVIDLSS